MFFREAVSAEQRKEFGKSLRATDVASPLLQNGKGFAGSLIDAEKKIQRRIIHPSRGRPVP